jgi:prepilin-type N-terminal cleavage/methylation domain-containing protein
MAHLNQLHIRNSLHAQAGSGVAHRGANPRRDGAFGGADLRGGSTELASNGRRGEPVANETHERSAGRRRVARGYTFIEILTVVVIIAVITGMAFSSWKLLRTRADLTTTAMEIQTAIQTARQQALASARDVVVMFFPSVGNGEGGFGRVVVLDDGEFPPGGFMSGAGGANFCNFNAISPGAAPRSRIIASIDLPRGVLIGVPPPTTPIGISFPFTTVPAPATGCSFCDAGLVSGAIRFDMTGKATFYRTCSTGLGGGPLVVSGGSVALNAVRRTAGGNVSEIRGTSLLYILPTGLVRSFHGG